MPSQKDRAKRPRIPGSKRLYMTRITPKKDYSSPEDSIKPARPRIPGSKRLHMTKRRKPDSSSSGDSIAEYIWGNKDIVRKPISRMVGKPKFNKTKTRMCRKSKTESVPNFKLYASRYGKRGLNAN